ncbi:family 3 adenylate cyclase [Beggiatoa alba B18LD]|uniref:Family 3 adenylate cyclase n=1 Tax=Beggiatoa alba B18LD TaxID=395493 RepID=I3CHL2_9GAMM|nr:MASE1 domain-containing protein [Beggiatoa alba]EIJ43105.1 family 3 adenylate cyclase [Beggiatoa alba B18LD]
MLRIPLIKKLSRKNRNRLLEIGNILSFAVVYYLISELSIILGSTTGDVTAIWPVAGLGFAVMFIWGYRFLISVWLGELNLLFLESFSHEQLWIATGNAVALFIAVWFIKRYAKNADLFGYTKNVIFFIFFAVLLSSMISASVGNTALYFYGIIEASSLLNNWWTWWLADIVGVLVVAPLIITWHQEWHIHWTRSQLFEAISLFFSLGITAWLIFGQPLSEGIRAYPMAFLMMPFIIWSIFRFGQRETMTVIFLLSVIAIFGTIMRVGPFVLPSLYQSLLLLQAFIGVICLTTLFLMALISERTKLEASMSRFVPHEFLSFLNKTSIIDVNLGDHTEREMSVLFSDIRGFTSLSEAMTPQQNFNFINAYLSRMEPIISEHQGFIDKYIGDAIMALFPKNADQALQAAIEMLQTLNQYNETRGRPGRPKLRIGIGIHTGLLMLGTVGGQSRMDGTVISDAVNLASRTESLTKTYGVCLLITEQTYQKLKDPTQYKIRLLDRVIVKGKTNLVTLYEVYDADLPPLIALKNQTLSQFEQACLSYHQTNFLLAQQLFEMVLSINEQDDAAKVYLDRCHNHLRNPCANNPN